MICSKNNQNISKRSISAANAIYGLNFIYEPVDILSIAQIN
jgi:hypothetical protein